MGNFITTQIVDSKNVFERSGDFLLTPARKIWGGRKVTYAQIEQSKGVEKIEPVSFGKKLMWGIALLITFIFGMLLKGVGYLFSSDMRERLTKATESTPDTTSTAPSDPAASPTAPSTPAPSPSPSPAPSPAPEPTKPKEEDLYKAIEVGDTQKVSRLLESGNISFAESWHQLPFLHLAIEKNGEEIFTSLLRCEQISVNSRFSPERGYPDWINAQKRGNLPIFQSTPLHHAARRGYNIYVQQLVNAKNINVNTMDIAPNRDDNTFLTPLHLAALNGHDEVITTLLKADEINVNTRTRWGETPLHLAALNGHTKAVEALLKSDKINVYIKTIAPCKTDSVHFAVEDAQPHQFGLTPFDYAMQSGNRDVVDALTQSGKYDDRIGIR